MKKRFHFISSIALKSEYAFILLLGLYIIKLFVVPNLSSLILNFIETIFSITTVLLIFYSVILFAFEPFTREDFQKQLNKYTSDFYDQSDIETIKKISEINLNIEKLKVGQSMHFLKDINLISNESNYGKYLLLLFLIPLLSFALKINHLEKYIIIIIVVSIFVLYLFLIIVREGILINKHGITNMIIHSWFIVLALYFIKPEIIYHFGNDTMGSYFEKLEYDSKYYVKIRSNENQNLEFLAPADIHVRTETESLESGVDQYGNEKYSDFNTRFVVVKKVFNVNGKILEFKGCEFEVGETSTCSDQFNNNWNIELTKKKVSK